MEERSKDSGSGKSKITFGCSAVQILLLLAGKIRDLTDYKALKQARSVDPYHFTSREIEGLKLLSQGKTNREIARELLISTGTVATHVSNSINKDNLANRNEAAA